MKLRNSTFTAVLLVSTSLLLGPGLVHAEDPTISEILGFEKDPFGDYWVESPDQPAEAVERVSEDTFVSTSKGALQTVVPYAGTYMVRLGVPEESNNESNQGSKSVEWELDAGFDIETPQPVALRLFSWDHRGDDLLRITVTNANGVIQSIDVTVPFCETQSTTPFECLIDIGKRGDLEDSDWVKFQLPALAAGSTIKYEIVEGQNESHASWVYFDFGNRPPVARFNLQGVDGTNTHEEPEFCVPDLLISGTAAEGAVADAEDRSCDPDENDSVVAWEWTLVGGPFSAPDDQEPEIIFQQHPRFLIPDEGFYFVSLRVQDGFGAWSETLTKKIKADNLPPMVRALNQEVLPRQPFELIGRAADPGFLDWLGAEWALDYAHCDDPVTTAVEQDCSAELKQTCSETVSKCMRGEWTQTQCEAVAVEKLCTPLLSMIQSTASGFAPAKAGQDSCTEGSTESGECWTGTLTITDKGEDVEALDYFKIRVLVESDLDRNEDSVVPWPLEAGWVHRYRLNTLEDLDIFEITGRGLTAIPAGGEVLVQLKDLPADYDLVLFTKLPEGAPTLSSASWIQSPVDNGVFSETAQLALGVNWNALGINWAALGVNWNALGVNWNALGINWAALGINWAALGVNWNALGINWAALGVNWNALGINWAALGINWAALGVDGFQASVPLSTFAQFELDGKQLGGTDLGSSEVGLDVTTLMEDGWILAGFSANRGLEEERVLLRTEYPNTEVFAAVVSNNGVFSPNAYAVQVEVHTPLDLDTEYPLQDKSQSLVQSAALNDAPCYLDEHDNPLQYCELVSDASPTVLFVTQRERFEDANGLGSLDGILGLVDDISGARAISINPDAYAAWAPGSVDAANAVAEYVRGVIQGELSGIKHVVIIGGDDIVPFRRVPDQTSVSNESRYVSQSGVDPSSPLFASLFHGHILTDDYYVSAHPLPWQGRGLYVPDLPIARLVETPAEIAQSLTLPALNSNPTGLVTGYDFFADGARLSADYLTPLTGSPTPLISDNWDTEDLSRYLLGSDEYASADVSNVNAHFTHTGALSASGFEEGVGTDFLSSDVVRYGDLSGRLVYSAGCHAGFNVPGSDGIDYDFPQAMSGSQAVFIGNTGFGLGAADAVAGNEKLMALYSDEIANGLNATVGDALVAAKRRYVQEANSFTVYDEKALIQATIYGLPTQALPTGAPVDIEWSSNGCESLVVNGTTYYQCLNDAGADIGKYYRIDGENIVVPWRPIQPKIVLQESAKGVLITGGSYVDEANFNPVIARPIDEWTGDADESEVCLDAYWPASIASVNSAGGISSVILVPGQFQCQGLNEDGAFGTQRRYTAVDYVTTSPESGPDPDDVTPPTVNEVDFREVEVDGVDHIRITVDAYDASEIGRIVVLVLTNESVTHVNVEDQYPTGAGPYTFDVRLSDIGGVLDGQLVIQVVDKAGNVTVWTGKGANARVLSVDAYAPMIVVAGDETVFTGTVFDFDDVLVESPSAFYRWNFGDDSDDAFATGILAREHEPVLGLARSQVEQGDEYQYGVVDAAVYQDEADPGNALFTEGHVYSQSGAYTATLKVTDAVGGVGVDDVDLVVLRACDERDPAFHPDLDYVGCLEDSEDEGDHIWVEILLNVAGEIQYENQYRLYIDYRFSPSDSMPDGSPDAKITWTKDSVNGMKSADWYRVGDNNLVIRFDLNELDWNPEDAGYIQWYAEIQKGTQSNSIGFADRMPDEGHLESVQEGEPEPNPGYFRYYPELTTP